MKTILTYSHDGGMVHWCDACFQWHRYRLKDGVADLKCSTSLGKGFRTKHGKPKQAIFKCVGPLPDTLKNQYNYFCYDPPSFDINQLPE